MPDSLAPPATDLVLSEQSVEVRRPTARSCPDRRARRCPRAPSCGRRRAGVRSSPGRPSPPRAHGAARAPIPGSPATPALAKKRSTGPNRLPASARMSPRTSVRETSPCAAAPPTRSATAAAPAASRSATTTRAPASVRRRDHGSVVIGARMQLRDGRAREAGKLVRERPVRDAEGRRLRRRRPDFAPSHHDRHLGIRAEILQLRSRRHRVRRHRDRARGEDAEVGASELRYRRRDEQHPLARCYLSPAEPRGDRGGALAQAPVRPWLAGPAQGDPVGVGLGSVPDGLGGVGHDSLRWRADVASWR